MIQRFALATHAYRRFMEPVAEKYGITMAELTTLLVIEDSDKPDIHAGDISDAFGMAKSHVSSAVNALCAKGYLLRTPDPTDRKKQLLHLTGQADEVVRDGIAERKRFVNLCLDGFSPMEREIISEMLERIHANLEETI